MKHPLKRIRYQWVLIIIVIVFGLAGCTKKKDEDHAAKFVGTWHVTGNCVGGTGGSSNLIFSAGSAKNTITYEFSVGSGSCEQLTTITGTANGNTATFKSIMIADGCGLIYPVNAIATIVGSTITYNLNVSGAAVGSCTMSGTK